VYARLLREWQRNDAQIRDHISTLESPYISTERRATLVKEIDELKAKNAEIERLANEYG